MRKNPMNRQDTGVNGGRDCKNLRDLVTPIQFEVRLVVTEGRDGIIG